MLNKTTMNIMHKFISCPNLLSYILDVLAFLMGGKRQQVQSSDVVAIIVLCTDMLSTALLCPSRVHTLVPWLASSTCTRDVT